MSKKPVQRKRRRRNITIPDCEAICRLVECERFTFLEACECLKINYETWRSWKSRAANEPRFLNTLARVKGSYIRGQIKNIQDGAKGLGPHKRADWRASDRLLAIADPSRYGTQPVPPTPSPPAHPRNS
jgi:hypothetical protein